jgi:hypothetical protein
MNIKIPRHATSYMEEIEQSPILVLHEDELKTKIHWEYKPYQSGTNHDIYKCIWVEEKQPSVSTMILRVRKEPVETMTDIDAIDFEKEMRLTSLFHDIMPSLYMYGYYHVNDIYTRYPKYFPFAVMQKLDMNLEEYLSQYVNIDDINHWNQIVETLFHNILQKYDIVAKHGYCILDATPTNIVIDISSPSPNHPISYLIDMETSFVIQDLPKEYNEIMMKYIFLNYVKKYSKCSLARHIGKEMLWKFQKDHTLLYHQYLIFITEILREQTTNEKDLSTSTLDVQSISEDSKHAIVDIFHTYKIKPL